MKITIILIIIRRKRRRREEKQKQRIGNSSKRRISLAQASICEERKEGRGERGKKGEKGERRREGRKEHILMIYYVTSKIAKTLLFFFLLSSLGLYEINHLIIYTS